MNDELRQELRMEKMAAMREKDGLSHRQGRLMDALMELDKVTDSLEQKLAPVLRERAPGPALHGEPLPADSQLSLFLQEATSRAQQLATRMADLGDRVDL